MQPGDVYGFRLSGSNSDFNNFLRGTFTLSTKPYVDATIGTDNRQWIGATEISTATLPAATAGYLEEPGEARWYKFRVVPGQQATVNLTSPADYDLALVRRHRQRLRPARRAAPTSTQLAAASAAGAPGSETQTPVYDRQRHHDPDDGTKPPVTTQFAPRIYAPRIYAPRIYAPRIYAPADLRAADLRAADLRTRLVRARPRVQHLLPRRVLRRAEPDAARDVRQHRPGSRRPCPRRRATPTATSTSACRARRPGVRRRHAVQPEAQPHRRRELPRARDLRRPRRRSEAPGNPAAVIVTDTNKLMLSDGSHGPADLPRPSSGPWRRAPGESSSTSAPRRACRALQDQVATHPTCPYATNLVAREIQSIVDRYRGDATKYVVIAGGDDVIPFFRYPDTSGLGQESQFEPPVQPEHPGRRQPGQRPGPRPGRLRLRHRGDDQRPHDAGAGPRGRAPGEDAGARSWRPSTTTSGSRTARLPAPTSSLVTGYDFLADAADAVDEEFATALAAGDRPQRPADHPGGHAVQPVLDGDAAQAGAAGQPGTTSSTWPATSAPTTRWPPTSRPRSARRRSRRTTR